MRRHLPVLLFTLIACCFTPLLTVGQSATPTTSEADGVGIEEICTATIPAASLPAGESFVDFWRTTMQPGVIVDFPAEVLIESAGIDCIEEGAYRVRHGGDIEIVRGANGEAEQVPAGTETRAGAGDVVRFIDNNQSQMFATDGDAPVVLISVSVLSTEQPPCGLTSSCPGFPDGVTFQSLGGIGESTWGQSGLSGQDVTLSVRRVSLEPGAERTMTGDASAAIQFVESGTLTWTITRPDTAAVDDNSITFPAGTSVPYFKPKTGETVTLHNDGAKSIVFLELEISAALPGPGATPVQ